MRNGLVRPHWVNPHVLCVKKTTSYKCESYKAMTRKEKMRFVKRQNLCFNCLKGAHRAEKCPSKNRCHHPKCAETHHRFLHDYFKKKVEETAMEDVKVYMSKLPQVQNIYRLHLSKWEQQMENISPLMLYWIQEMKAPWYTKILQKRLNLAALKILGSWSMYMKLICIW